MVQLDSAIHNTNEDAILSVPTYVIVLLRWRGSAADALLKMAVHIRAPEVVDRRNKTMAAAAMQPGGYW